MWNPIYAEQNYTKSWMISRESRANMTLHELTKDRSTSSSRSRIFPRVVRQLPKLLLFFRFLPKTSWKWKNLDPHGGARPWRPLGSANDKGTKEIPCKNRAIHKVTGLMVPGRSMVWLVQFHWKNVREAVNGWTALGVVPAGDFFENGR